MRDAAELHDAVELQKQVWGDDFTEIIPSSVLKVVQQVGGIAIGAFVENRLVGLLFGISGIRDGELAHWSDTLAVLPEYRDLGIGRRLKWQQRDRLLVEGVERIHWTFDPLESRNAYVNLVRLGAVAGEYRRDFYGATASILHEGLETDRLVASWEIRSDRVARRLAGERGWSETSVEGVPLVNQWRSSGQLPIAGEPDLSLTAPAVRLAIPADIQELRSRSPEVALDWRRTTRAAFEAYLGRGYAAIDLVRGPECSCYVLELAEGATA
ncbi:MAG TPA: GNAT family N-acetyltransferase [Gemmatimonadaceae bacterium]|nr:GNAT family N-acetyltransferase [Gemmatimonadaceae bacterium]